MTHSTAIAVLGTFDSKGDEHQFLKNAIRDRGGVAITINVGTRKPSSFPADIDLFTELKNAGKLPPEDRDRAISAMLLRGREVVGELFFKKRICGIVSAGGGSGTHLCSSIMKVLPLGAPKVMVSTVASRDMSDVVGTRDITMMHRVVDLLGINSITGGVLDRAAAAVCGMVKSGFRARVDQPRIALSFFGFITPAAEKIREHLGAMGYEVIAFHANGTGGMALEELASEGYFAGILDLATHELADALKNGYCGGIGPGRFEPSGDRRVPRLVVPGGMDCAVLEFTRQNIPDMYRDRRIFFYDFRSAVRLSAEESLFLAGQLAEKLNKDAKNIRVVVPGRGWSAADIEGGPLYDPAVSRLFMEKFRDDLDNTIGIETVDAHINDNAFARIAAERMDRMLRS